MVTAMSGAIKTLSLALTAGPAGAIAAVVGGLAIAIGVFTTASNNAAHAGERWAEKMESTSGKAESLLTDWQRLNGEKALDEQTSTRLLALYPGLAEKMDVNTASAQELLAAIKELNRENAASAAKEWIDKLQKQQEELKKAEEALDKYTVKAKENIEISISMGDAAKAKEFEEALEVYADVVDKTRKKIANSIDQANAILATVGQQLGENNTIIDIPITVTPDEDEAKKAAEAAAKAAAEAAAAEADKLNKTLKQKLADMSLTTEQQLNEQLNAVTAFLAQRAELELTDSEERILAKEEELARIKEFDDLSNEEKYLAETELLTQLADLRRTAGEERITAYQEELARIQENEDLSNEEKTIAEKAANQAIINLHKQMATEDDKILKDKFKKYQEYKKKEEEAADAAAAKEQELLEERLGALSTFFSSIGSLLEDSSKHNRGFAIAARAMAAAEAAINSYLAFTKALASAPPPANYVLAAAALTAGIAQQIKIISTPIPSAETGGRFVVPTAVGSDSRLMRVNPGEEIDVTPRGMAGFNNAQTITVQIEKQVIFDVVNDGIRSNDILIEAVNY
jgi:hypothetical protein